MTKFIVVAITALCVHAFGLITLSMRIEPFMYNFYVLSWWSYIFFLDAVLGIRRRKFLIVNRSLPYLIIMSSAFWCIFELINFRLSNWFYINIPEGNLRYFGYLIAFGTVIPGIYLTKEAVHRVIGDLRITPVLLRHQLSGLFVSGFAILLLVLAFPNYFFALTWVFLIPVMDVINYLKRHTSFIGEMERGYAGGMVSTILAGMICGFLWELWNYWAISKWVYTVPFFEDVKLFEMPVLGYLGFAFFAVEVIVFFNFFIESRLIKKYSWHSAAAALVFSMAIFLLIERHTVSSHLATLDQLRFIADEKREQLRTQGVLTSYAVDRSILSPEEQRFLDLIHLKGLGLENAEKLKDNGIISIDSLSRLSPAQMCSIIGEPENRRCRVYIAAARGLHLGY